MRDKNGHLRMNPNVSHKQAKKMKYGDAEILAICMEKVITISLQLKT